MENLCHQDTKNTKVHQVNINRFSWYQLVFLVPWW
jgi:hypothetical protein